MFEKILKDSKINIIQKLAKELNLMNKDYYNPEFIEPFTKLAYYLYLFNDENLKLLLEDFNTFEFINYDTWSWIEPLIMLKNRYLLPEFNYKNEVLKVLEKGNEIQIQVKKRTFLRLLSGETLYQKEIDLAKKEKDLLSEQSYLLSSIMKLIVITEMGASLEFTTEMANKKLNEYKEQLLSIIS
ncbi:MULTISPECIES: DUF6707 family protein [Flavobacterium]|uniref:DUF6707 family protein n=1 Tax=Flavobacterium TaxID=237 RepID=UPI000B5C108C|nr:DUF6707 family protein [Flavobacterium columnare]OXA71048.1 hypothetical protein B0A56_14125 [Flavobacterium columnare NBRC 100251 = ATCC 23463]